MNYYPEQMDAISELCKLLNDWEKKHTETYFYFGKGITLYSQDSDDEVFGYLRDEIGAAWSFTPAGGE